jgi:LuxR family transcriptional regulator, quorum-sensing system regulator CciR
VSPIAAVCRMSTQPFAWDAETVAAAITKAPGRADVRWPLTPQYGFFGGITVPIHMPRARTGSVSWYSRDPMVDVFAVLEADGDVLRLAAQRFMDLVYSARVERESCGEAPLGLSERELECLSWAALGRTDADIGSIIYRSPATARFHIDNAVRKLGARNRTQAVAIAAQRGLIHPLQDLGSLTCERELPET